jgi:hypothetical protein
VGKFSKKGMGLFLELDSIFILTKEIYFLLLELFFISWALKFGFKSTKSLDPGVFYSQLLVIITNQFPVANKRRQINLTFLESDPD